MTANKEFIDAAVKILMVNFGENMAKAYESSFINRTEEEIRDIISELLAEFIGRENAAKQLAKLN